LAFIEALRLANAMMTVRPQLRIRLVLNRCKVRASVTRDITQALADYDPPADKLDCRTRAVFVEVMENGRLAFELLHSRTAAQEITALAAEVERIAS
jgi:chromosome partitioning protein